MPEKQEVLDSITNEKTYIGSKVKDLVNSVKTASPKNTHEPLTLKIGDVFLSQCGAKTRPVVVISIREKKNLVIAVPLTTTDDEIALSPYTSRFFREGYFSNQLLTFKIDYVKERFVGVLDNRKAIKEAKKQLNKFYKGIL